ncbi:MAG: hypothetical protein O3B87_02270 [bacterium]|nr:hypothetical protein [bacterium]
MGFSFPFLKSRKKSQEYFGLYLTDSSAYGFLFNIDNGTETILAQNAFGLTAGFEHILEDIDNLISDIELKTNTHVDQTIFFLHSWMIDEESLEIKDPYKGIIQKLAKDLELKPLGYIDVEEALLRNLKAQSIMNAVSIEVNKSKLGVFIYKGGVKIHHQYTARTDDVGDDISSVLESLPKHVVVPSKLFIYGDDDKAEVSSELATFEWDQSIFPEHPTLEVVKQQDINEALIQVFAKEMLGQEGTSEEKPIMTSHNEPEINDSMGFVVGKDIMLEGTPKDQSHLTKQPMEPSISKVNPISQLVQNIKKISNGTNTSNRKSHVMIGTVMVAAFLALAGYEYFLHKLDITIYVQATKVEENIDLEVPLVEKATQELAVVKKSVKSAFTEQKKATGTKEVGERATGSVVVHNWDTGERSFTRGTKLTYNNLIFTLDTDIKVASASGITKDGLKQSGKTKVNVTASDIGKEYNVASGVQFSAESLPESLFLAIADGAFKGGSSKAITTISKKDMDTLEQQIEEKAEAGSEDVLGSNVSKDDVLLTSLTSASLGETSFSGEVGEEAEILTLNAESEIEFYSISDRLLKRELISSVKKKIKDGYTVEGTGITYTMEDVDEDGDVILVNLDVVADSYRMIDTKKVLGIVTGKSQSSVESKIKSLYEVEKVDMSGILWTPFISKNITIQTKIK